MEIIKFFFCNIWHFIGLVIVLSLLGEFILKLIAILRGGVISKSDVVDDSGKVDYVDNRDEE